MAADTTAPSNHAKSDGNVKETVESILVAFILAFIFRAFVVEAFVIPTGSMAPTLYGAHMRFRCPDCGYSFDVGYSAPRSQGDEEPNIPASADQPDACTKRVPRREGLVKHSRAFRSIRVAGESIVRATISPRRPG